MQSVSVEDTQMNDRQRKARARYAEAYRGSAHGKAKRKAYEQSEAGRLSMRLRNQRRRAKSLATRAAEVRDDEGNIIGRRLDDGTIRAL